MNKPNPLKVVVVLISLITTVVVAACANPKGSNLVACSEASQQCGYDVECCEGLRCTFSLPAGISTCK